MALTAEVCGDDLARAACVAGAGSASGDLPGPLALRRAQARARPGAVPVGGSAACPARAQQAPHSTAVTVAVAAVGRGTHRRAGVVTAGAARAATEAPGGDPGRLWLDAGQ